MNLVKNTNKKRNENKHYLSDSRPVTFYPYSYSSKPTEGKTYLSLAPR